MRLKWLIVLGLAFLQLAGAPPAAAHPHVWIDLRSQVVFDGAGRIAALRIDWLFDEFYSAYAMETVPRTKGPKQDAALAALARGNLESLAEYGYFVDLRVDGARVPTRPAKDGRNTWDGRRLTMSFTLPLGEPVDPRAGRVEFAVYDPSYYIEILYLKGDPVGLVNSAGTGCAARVVQPNLNAEATNLAGTLGRDETATATLGKLFSSDPGKSFGALFAETTIVECR
jgi:ABC-type uncharacterized transport system substrate-binding protein